MKSGSEFRSDKYDKVDKCAVDGYDYDGDNDDEDHDDYKFQIFNFKFQGGSDQLLQCGRV